MRSHFSHWIVHVVIMTLLMILIGHANSFELQNWTLYRDLLKKSQQRGNYPYSRLAKT